MANKAKSAGIVLVLLMAIAATVYIFMTPYNRIAGISVGGSLTPPPADWTTVNDLGVVQLKTGGFPPFVVNIIYSTDEGGVITATRPDGGYWGKRARIQPNGWIRLGDNTYALKATEIFGDERIPYLESYGGKNNMSMRYDFTGEIIRGQTEPLHTWEVFYWTPR